LTAYTVDEVRLFLLHIPWDVLLGKRTNWWGGLVPYCAKNESEKRRFHFQYGWMIQKPARKPFSKHMTTSSRVSLYVLGSGNVNSSGFANLVAGVGIRSNIISPLDDYLPHLLAT